MRAIQKTKRRLVALLTLVFAVLLGAIEFVTVKVGENDAKVQLLNKAKGVAVAVAHMLELDAEGYREFTKTKDAGSDYYKKMQDKLLRIKDETSEIRFITTENRLSAEVTEYILDAERIGSEDYASPGGHGKNNENKDRAFTNGETVSYESSKGTANKWGKLLVSYAPIRADDGEILGIVGVDIEQRYALGDFKNTILALVVADIVILGLMAAAIAKFSGKVMDRMFRDKLTGAFTKRHFDTLLRDGIARCIKYKHGLALMMLDLDHFKNVNDTYGHPFGDKVLEAVSDIIRSSIRPEDSFVRYGGEEFALIVASAGAKNVMDVAERLRLAVEGTAIYNRERDTMVKITISIGVARLVNLSQTPEELVEHADKALYAAKVTRNAVKLYE